MNAEVLAISVDDLSGATDIADRVGIPFPVLYDPDGTVPKAYMVYGLIESNRAAHSTFILDKNGVITWNHLGRTISDRIGPYSILQQLQAIQS